MLEIQRYLTDGGDIAALETTYGITAKRHPRFPQLALFKYNQIASPMHERIVQECRGIILDASDGWRVVARAFDKFFNHGEGHAAPIDWPSARVQEKLDGSLCLVYHYADEWHVATTGTPDASGDINGSGLRFSDLFWQTLGTAPGRFECDAKEVCFYFELMSPHNRVVVVHERPRLVLLGARILTTGEEMIEDRAHAYIHGHHDIETVREFSLASVEDITATFTSMSPLAQEGYVVVDAAFRRIKVKHPGYVALHHAKDGMSQRAFITIAQSGEVSEVIAAFPEFKPMLDETRARFDALCAEVEADYARLRGIETQKAFALEAVKTRCSAALFAVRSGKASSVRGYFAGVHVDQMIRLLGYRETAAQ